MATLLRRRDERDLANDITNDVEANGDTTDRPPPVVSSETSFEEPGSKIWLPYLELADKYDKDLVHNWRDDMDSLLIFAALFSASVTAFVIESYNSLVQDPAEVTISVLLQISRQIANGTQATGAVRPSFQPATIDVAINILWFLSLAFSLTCALAAVLVRQWARQYLRYPRSFSATSEQARARQFVFENMQWWKMDVVVDMIPALLHISMILFFIGLLLFVRAVSYSLAVYLLCFSAIGGAAYSLLTTLPLIFSACPYKTPFTGFFGLCITTLFRPMWMCTIVLVASLEISLLQLLSPVIRIWFPSFSILEWKVALKLSGPVRLAITRSRTYLREKRRASLKDITKNIGSTLTILQTCFRRCYQILHERREEFHDDLTIRDAHALRWTMEYSKRDTDLFTITTSVPEFVQLHDDKPWDYDGPDVHTIMQKSGVTLQAFRLLRLSAGSDDEVTNQSAIESCLESIISVMPCSTVAIGTSDCILEDQTSLITELLGITTMERLAIRSSLGSAFLCTFSNLLMYWMTALEEDVRADIQGYQRRTSVRLVVGMLSGLRSSWRKDDGLQLLSSALGEFCESLETFLWRSPSEFCKKLQELRSHWATSWLTFAMSLSLPHNALTCKSICHGATHLPHFPHSSRDSQCAVFAITDDLLRPHHGPRGSHGRLMNETTSVYSLVLFGCQMEYPIYTAGSLHTDFLGRVHVQGTSACRSMNSGEIVVVTYEQYTKILHNHASLLRQCEAEARIAELQADTDLDAHVCTITQFIRCRLKDGDVDGGAPFVIDAQHLTAARALLSHPNSEHRYGWFNLIERTAREFGYIPQLLGDYNIEIHAELSYYEHDLITWSLESSPSWQWRAAPLGWRTHRR